MIKLASRLELVLLLTLLDVVVRESSTIFKLLSGEDETLLVWRDSLLVLDLGLHILDRIGRLDLEGDGLARQSLDEDLHRAEKELFLLRQLLLHRRFNPKESLLRPETIPRFRDLRFRLTTEKSWTIL